MGFGESAIASFDWTSYETCGGLSARGMELALLRFINSKNADEASEAWGAIENVAFAQNTIYGSAEPLVEVLVAALSDDRPEWVRMWTVAMLRFVLQGGSLTDHDLVTRCRDRASRGFWMLAQLARTETGDNREDILDI